MEATLVRGQAVSVRDVLSRYLEITKPRIATLVAVSCTIGYYLGARAQVDPLLLAITIVGTILSSAGAAALNNVVERDYDKLMHRTSKRPVAQGEISPVVASCFGILLCAAGVGLLAVKVNMLCAMLALATAALYVFVYTPLKRVSWLNTAVGAVPGAIPPLGGWAAATGQLELGAWALFLIMFIWQFPHFYAIAWMYREDYRRGGFQMLPVVDPSGERTFRQTRLFSALLVPAALLPFFLGFAGSVYAIGVIVLGFYFCAAAEQLCVQKTSKAARKVLLRSVLFLPLQFILIVVDSGPGLLFV